MLKPPEAAEEYFPVGSFGVYDIERAKKIIVEHPRNSRPVDVMEWIGFGRKMDLLPELEGRGADYNIPLIIATVDKDLGHYLLIDGWQHRLVKANREGILRVQGYYLTENETKEIFQGASLLGCGSVGFPKTS